MQSFYVFIAFVKKQQKILLLLFIYYQSALQISVDLFTGRDAGSVHPDLWVCLCGH